MKLAVICANGKAGKLIVKEALAHGLDVTAFVRGENHSDAEKSVSKDLFDLTRDDLKDFDAVVDAFGAWTPETISGITKAVKHLGSLLSGTETRLLVVGGAGSLYVNPEHTLTVADGRDFPDSWKPLAAAHGEALDFLRAKKDLKWTYVSPAADFQADRPKSGKYILAGEELTLSPKGESVIGYADYAAGFVDEIVNGKHIGERISLVEG